MLGGLTIHMYILWLQISYSVLCAKTYENWLAVGKAIAKIIRLTFLAHPVCIGLRINARVSRHRRL